jgi:hypothetical protein
MAEFELSLRDCPFLCLNPRAVGDMASLLHLHEAGILHNLCERASPQNQHPYTYVSTVLIALNPLRPVPMPAMEVRVCLCVCVCAISWSWYCLFYIFCTRQQSLVNSPAPDCTPSNIVTCCALLLLCSAAVLLLLLLLCCAFFCLLLLCCALVLCRAVLCRQDYKDVPMGAAPPNPYGIAEMAYKNLTVVRNKKIR